MPEMVPSIGKDFRVWRRIEQTCMEMGGGKIRRLEDTVALAGLRCDGSAHDGCARSCLLFWKEQWLKPAIGLKRAPDSPEATLKLLERLRTRDGERYVCQSTEMYKATKAYAPLDVRRFYLGALYRGNGLKDILDFAVWPVVEKFKRLVMGRIKGTLKKTPAVSLNLEPGDLVEVKSLDEIKATLNAESKTRGLTFERLMLPFVGRRFIVKRRVERMIDEETGRMKELKDTVALEGVTCDGHTRLGGCPREVYHFWREAWLRLVSPRRGTEKSTPAKGSEELAPALPCASAAQIRWQSAAKPAEHGPAPSL
jgi:hypothetical protein